jgi:hypothetical protein
VRNALAISCSTFLLGGVVALMLGCAAASPGDLSVTSSKIAVGRPIPPDITLPPGVTWNEKQGFRTACQSSKWSFGRLNQHITVAVDRGNVVTGKRYVYVRGEAFGPFVWQYEHAISEWDLLAPREATIDYLKKACERLNSEYRGVLPCPEVSDFAAILDSAFKHVHFAQDHFAFEQYAPTKPKSLGHAFGVGHPVWQVRRIAPDVLRIRIEDRVDICPIIATPAAWIWILFHNPF